MKTFLIVIVSLVALGVAGYFVVGGMGINVSTGGKALEVEVRTEAVGLGRLVEVVSAPGQVEPRTKVQISAKISARITELPFEEGQRVTKGSGEDGKVPASVLVRLDASDLAANLKATEARFEAQKASLGVAEMRIRSRRAELESAKVLAADAERDFARQAALLKTSDVSQVVVDAAQVKLDQMRNQLASSERSLEADVANLGVLRHELDAAEAQILQARESLSYAVISSPIDGTVVRLNAKVGELVVTGTMNNAGTVIIEVADLSRMLVVARIDEANITGVKVGQRATARSTAYPGKEFKGVVQSVALSKTSLAQAQQRGESGDGQPYFRAEVLLDEGTDALSGVSADVEVETKVHEGVLRVPTQSVLGRSVDELPEAARNSATVDRTRSIATVVFVVRNGKAMLVPVKVGASDLTHTVVESGLVEGDVVVTGPYKSMEGLKDGQGVKVTASRSTTAPSTQPSGASTQPPVAGTQGSVGSTTRP